MAGLILLILAGAGAICIGAVLLLRNTSEKEHLTKTFQKPEEVRRTDGMISDYREVNVTDRRTGEEKIPYSPRRQVRGQRRAL